MGRATLILILVAVATAVNAQGNSVCANWCATNFPSDAGSACTSLAAKGGGPCYVCGPLKTSQTELLCSGTCSQTSTDSKNCGKCGNVCPSGSTCSSSTCLCTGSTPLCNGACPNLQTDSNNCGKCGNVCPTGSTCSSGSCVCSGGTPLCNGACPNLQTDSNNCGKCGNVCPTGSTCSSGTCSCSGGAALCNGACPNLQTDSNNCGKCGNVCPTGSTCSSGTCSCSGGAALCNGACPNLLIDNNNCGKCGNICSSPATCSSGSCLCSGGTRPCNGACPNYQTDNNNCGSCGNKCPSSTTCSVGACACTNLAASPINFRSASILVYAGVGATKTTAATSAAQCCGECQMLNTCFGFAYGNYDPAYFDLNNLNAPPPVTPGNHCYLYYDVFGCNYDDVAFGPVSESGPAGGSASFGYGDCVVSAF